MSAKAGVTAPELRANEKAPTGIRGLDEITAGGRPRGRRSLFCSGPGCGKTPLGVEFLVRAATEFNEPGVLMAFGESGKKSLATLLLSDLTSTPCRHKKALPRSRHD